MVSQVSLIDGGVCAPKGFKASGVHCGIRKNRTKRDLALIYSDVPAAAAAVYTQNLVQGAPILVTKAHLKNGRAQAMLCNSGNANTCNADGVDIAEAMCRLVGDALSLDPADVIIASTGVIGQPLPLAPIRRGMKPLVDGLSLDDLPAAEAIMTTDTVVKRAAVSFRVGEHTVRLGGIAKGSGMIHPNMATLLVFLTTDARIGGDALRQALLTDVATSFNMVSVDGDTSTNDMLSILANGMAENPEILPGTPEYDMFLTALSTVTQTLCRLIAGDGEGATKRVTCKLTGAKDAQTARKVAKAVICSSLTKAALFGADANWGRVLCAIGYSGANVAIDRVDVAFASDAGTIAVCRGGAGIPFSEETAKAILLRDQIDILINLNDGTGCAEAWGCDLTYDYVKINGDYRT